MFDIFTSSWSRLKTGEDCHKFMSSSLHVVCKSVNLPDVQLPSDQVSNPDMLGLVFRVLG